MRQQLDKALSGLIWYMAANPTAAFRIQMVGIFSLAAVIFATGIFIAYCCLWLYMEQRVLFNGLFALFCASTIAWLIRMK